jgi:hypothetical protein
MYVRKCSAVMWLNVSLSLPVIFASSLHRLVEHLLILEQIGYGSHRILRAYRNKQSQSD